MLAAAWFALAGCGDDSGGDGGGAGEPVAPTAATLPDDVEPGAGALVLDGQPVALTVVSCDLEPRTDEATGVTTSVHAVAEDPAGRQVELVRASFDADVPTVTDTVTITGPGDAVVESSRADRDGLQIDLREANPPGPLLEVDEATGHIRADGVFGPPGSIEGDPANVLASLVLRCP